MKILHVQWRSLWPVTPKFCSPKILVPSRCRSDRSIWSPKCTLRSSLLGWRFLTSLAPLSSKLSAALLSGATLLCTWRVARCIATLYLKNRLLNFRLSQVHPSLLRYSFYFVAITNETRATMRVIIMVTSEAKASALNIFSLLVGCKPASRNTIRKILLIFHSLGVVVSICRKRRQKSDSRF